MPTKTKKPEVGLQVRPQPGANPMALIQLGIEKGSDLAQLEKMIDLQQKWEANEAKKAYNLAMAAFKQNPPKIDKDRNVSYVNSKGETVSYKHASLANTTEVISRALSEHGFSASWKTDQGDGGVTVTLTITHAMGHSESTSLKSAPDQSGGKNSIQALGSAITYLERYTLQALTGVVAHDMPDDDGRSAGEEITTISEKQVKTINDIITKKDIAEALFLKYMKVEKVEDILEPDFEKAIIALEKSKGRKNEK